MGLAAEKKARGRIVSARKEVTEQLRLRSSFERRLVRGMINWYADVGVKAQREYQNNPTRNIRLAGIEASLSRTLLPHYASVIETMVGRFNTLQTKQETEWNRFYRSFVENQGSFAITNISLSTRNRVRKIIDDGMRDGLSVDDIAKQLVDKTQPAFTRARAAVVARTETHSAASYANHRQAKEIDVPLRKRWVATNDGRTRSHHAAANGQEVGMDEDFTINVGGLDYKMAYAGDPRGGPANTINCRCVIVYIEPEDVVVDETTPIGAPPLKPWGDETDEATYAHERSWQFAPTALLSIIRQMPKARTGFNPNASTSYYMPSTNSITMRYRREELGGNSRASNTWRHEYGHFVDYNASTVQFRPASRTIAGSLLDDRKAYSKSRQTKAGEAFEADLQAHKAKHDGFLGNADFDEIMDQAKAIGFTTDDINNMFNGIDWGQTKAQRYQVWLTLTGLKHRYIQAFDDAYLNQNRIQTEKLNWTLADYLGSMSNRLVGWGHSYNYYQKFPSVRRGVTTAHTTEVMANYFAMKGSEGAETWTKIIEMLAPSTTKAMDDLVEQIERGDKI